MSTAEGLNTVELTSSAVLQYELGLACAQDSKANTALHFAAGYARGDLARRLIEAGANGAVENCNGNTPLELVTCGPCHTCFTSRRTCSTLCVAQQPAKCSWPARPCEGWHAPGSLEKRNPLNQDADTLALLENAATAGLALLEQA